jgi:hypothetical protein
LSEIRANTISDAAGTGPVTLTKQSAAKAWVNFNGTGTIAARDSFNVASLTDNGTGVYIVNFTSAFGAANFSPTASGRGENNVTLNTTDDSIGSTSSQIVCVNSSGTTDDSSHVYFNAHGDLA